MMGYLDYGSMYGNGWGGHGFGFGFLFMLFGLVVLIALIVGVVRWLSGPSNAPQHHLPHHPELNRQAQRNEVLHILEKRFARGDIDEEEFRKRRQVILDDH